MTLGTCATVTNGAYTIRTYDDPVLRRIALADVDFTTTAPQTIPLPVGGFPAERFLYPADRTKIS
jgi:hypothetical protein